MDIKQFQANIDAIAAEYKAAVNDEKLGKTVRDRVYKEHGIDGLNDQGLIDRAIEDAKLELKKTAIRKIDDAKAAYKPHYEKLVSESERALVRVNSGITIAERWAKTHGITLPEAQAELSAYAKVKTSNFTDNTADRYAAIVNNGISENAHASHLAIRNELESVNMARTKDAIDKANNLLSLYSGSILSRYESSGYIIARQLESKNQE